MKTKSIKDLKPPMKCIGSQINSYRPRSDVFGSNSFPSLFSTSFSHHWEELQLKSPVMTTQQGFLAAIWITSTQNLRWNRRIQFSSDLGVCKWRQRKTFSCSIGSRIQCIQGGYRVKTLIWGKSVFDIEPNITPFNILRMVILNEV